MQAAHQPTRWPGGLNNVSITALIAAYMLLQAGVTAVAGSHASAAIYLFAIVAPLLATLACSRAAWRSEPGATRQRWIMLAAAMLLWSTGISLSAWQDLTAQVPSDTTYFSDFAFFIYGAPVLLAISSATDQRAARMLRWHDAVQVLLAACLAYVAIFSVTPFQHRTAEPISITLLVMTYNVENVVLALLATLRLFAHRGDGAQGHFYRQLSGFLWTYALCAALYNGYNLMLYSSGDPATVAGIDTRLVSSLVSLLPPVAFLLLAMLALQKPAIGAQQGNAAQRSTALLIDNLSPVFFTAALLGLGFVIMREHFYLAACALFVALALYALRSATLQSRTMQSERALRAALDKLEKLSLTDALTKVANRRCFDQTLQQEWQRHARSGEPLALMIIDIDFFKSLNDTFGHPYGDASLVKVAAALQSALPRASDLVARYGGEEFAAILPNTSLAGAQAVAQKMQAAIAEAAIVQAPARGGIATASIGLALVEGRHGLTPEALLGSADQALYRAKQNGRNRIEHNLPGQPAGLTLIATAP